MHDDLVAGAGLHAFKRHIGAKAVGSLGDFHRAGNIFGPAGEDHVLFLAVVRKFSNRPEFEGPNELSSMMRPLWGSARVRRPSACRATSNAGCEPSSRARRYRAKPRITPRRKPPSPAAKCAMWAPFSVSTLMPPAGSSRNRKLASSTIGADTS